MYSLTDEIRMNADWAVKVQAQIDGLTALQGQLRSVENEMQWLLDTMHSAEGRGEIEAGWQSEQTWRDVLMEVSHHVWITLEGRVDAKVVPGGGCGQCHLMVAHLAYLAGRVYEQAESQVVDELRPITPVDIWRALSELRTMIQTLGMVLTSFGGLK
jgi:hypothetical protein